MLHAVFNRFPLCILFLAAGFIQNTTAQGHLQRPDISVNPVIVFENDTVEVTCEAPVTGVRFALYKDTQDKPLSAENVSGDTYTFSVTDRELLQGESLTALYSNVQLSCDYTREARSERSQKKTVTVYMVLSDAQTAEIRVNAVGVTEAGSISVTCSAPPRVVGSVWRLFRNTEDSPLMSQTSEGQQQHFSVSGTRLLQGVVKTGPIMEVEVSCDYTETEKSTPSQRSEKKKVKVLGKLPQAELKRTPEVISMNDPVLLRYLTKPNISVSENQNVTLIKCIAPPPITGCMFYLSFNNTETEKQAAAGERAVNFTVLQSFNSAQTYCCRYQYRTIGSDLQCTGAEENQGSDGFLWRHILSAVVLLAAVGFLLQNFISQTPSNRRFRKEGGM